MELTDDELEAVSGGIERNWAGKYICPRCNSTKEQAYVGDGYYRYRCYDCGNNWTEDNTIRGPRIADGILGN